MIAIDTNVIVRILEKDHPAQTEAAHRAVAAGAYVPPGVLIETECVLRSIYRWDRQRIARAIGSFLALPTVSVDSHEQVLWALDRFATGADWADMLHITPAAGRDAFATFEKDMPRAAGDASPVPVRVLS